MKATCSHKALAAGLLAALALGLSACTREWADRTSTTLEGPSPYVVLPDQNIELGRYHPRTIEGSLTQLRLLGDSVLTYVQTPHEGRLYLVNLGPKDQIDRLQLAEGTPARIIAVPGQYLGQNMLLATQIQAGLASLEVRQPALASTGDQVFYGMERDLAAEAALPQVSPPAGVRAPGITLGPPTAAPFSERMVEGRLRNLRTAPPVMISEVVTDDGQVVPVNLGPSNQVARLELFEGEMVRVIGRPATFDGQQVLVASQIRAGNETLTITQSDYQTFGIERMVPEPGAEARPPSGQTLPPPQPYPRQWQVPTWSMPTRDNVTGSEGVSTPPRGNPPPQIEVRRAPQPTPLPPEQPSQELPEEELESE